jgi:isopentenyl phosphate kinase
VITDKAKPFTYRSDVASALAEEIASSDQRVVVVHGGGSFGHTLARQFGLSSSAYSKSAAGVAQTRSAMYELNQLVCKTMIEFKLSPYPFAPFDLLSRTPRQAASAWLNGLLRTGVTPVTFGDVCSYPGGFRVLSGDTIVHQLSTILPPERVVFAIDVDGIHEEDSTVVIQEISPARARRLRIQRGDDATGGMSLKVQIAAKIAAAGTEVRFVSGYRRNEFAKALKGLEFYGTVVRS